MRATPAAAEAEARTSRALGKRNRWSRMEQFFRKSPLRPVQNRPGPATKPGVPKPPKTSQIRPKPVLNPSETAPPASPVIPAEAGIHPASYVPAQARSVVPAQAGTHPRPLSTGAVGATSFRRRPEPIPGPSVVPAQAGTHPRPLRRSGAGRNPSPPPLSFRRRPEPIPGPYTPAPWAPPIHRRRGRV